VHGAFLNLEHVLLNIDEKDVDHIWRLLRGHVEFFWSAAKNNNMTLDNLTVVKK
jgi:hypothetical protein